MHSPLPSSYCLLLACTCTFCFFPVVAFLLCKLSFPRFLFQLSSFFMHTLFPMFYLLAIILLHALLSFPFWPASNKRKIPPLVPTYSIMVNIVAPPFNQLSQHISLKEIYIFIFFKRSILSFSWKNIHATLMVTLIHNHNYRLGGNVVLHPQKITSRKGIEILVGGCSSILLIFKV
jgi:hypothetical protein